MTTPIFDQAHPKIIEITFCFPVFAPPCKKAFHFINSFLRYSQLATPIQTFSDPLLIYVNLYQHAKNQAISLIYSGDMVDQKILQFDWLRTFWPISQEQNFFQIWDLCRNTANNIDFHYISNSVKIIDQIFQ